MMEKRMLKKVSTVTAAGIMMTAMLGMQVSAAESSDSETAVKKTPTITKQITKESNIYAPKTTFKFTVAPGTAVPAGENQEAIYAGPAKGVTLDKDVIASVPADSDIGNEKITVGTTKLNVNESVFTTGKNAKPGIFRYVVSEAAADKDGNAYEGVAYTTEQKYFDVYVTSDDDGKTFAKTGEPVYTPFENISIGLQEPGVYQFEDGRIWAWYRTNLGYQYETFSDDEGDTWSPVQPNLLFSSPRAPMQVKKIGKYTLAIFNPIPEHPANPAPFGTFSINV